MRNIKDFAIPFKFKDKITWKYAFAPQEKIDKILFPKKEEPKKDIPKTEPKPEPEVPKTWEVKKEEIIQTKKDSKKIESIFEEPKKPIKIKQSNKSFLEEIETFLEKQNTKIISIEEVDKKKVIAISESDSKKTMLFAFNKKRITETELFKCYKYAKKSNLPYRIITKDNPTKKMNDTIDAYKSLIKIEKLKLQKP